jgi:hypothetical protein
MNGGCLLEHHLELSLFEPRGKAVKDHDVVVDEPWIVRASEWAWQEKIMPPTMLVVSTSVGDAWLEEDVCMLRPFSNRQLDGKHKDGGM